MNEIYLSGGGAALPSIEEGFSQVFGKPLVKWSPVGKLESKLTGRKLEEMREAENQFTIAVGLASRMGKM